MAELHQATRRLQTALDRLERAIESTPARDGDAGVRAALEAARLENVALQDVARTVADRLDGAIARLKSSLGS